MADFPQRYETVLVGGVALEVEYAVEMDKDYGWYKVYQVDGVTPSDLGADMIGLLECSDIMQMITTECQKLEDSKKENQHD
jgi:hypothetical protein